MDAFTCAGCGAEYVVIVTDAVAARTSAASCLHCAASFVAISGKFVLQYTLLRRPALETEPASYFSSPSGG